MAKVERWLQHTWLEQYKWLAYSPSQQGGFANVSTFQLTDKGMCFIYDTYAKPKPVMGKYGDLAHHEQLQYRKDAASVAKYVIL